MYTLPLLTSLKIRCTISATSVAIAIRGTKYTALASTVNRRVLPEAKLDAGEKLEDYDRQATAVFFATVPPYR